MTYGAVTLRVEYGSLTVTKRKHQLVRHYPGTDRADVASLGRPPTVITCTLIAQGEAERVQLEQLLHSEDPDTLEFDGYEYRDVVTGESGVFEARTVDGAQLYMVRAEFVATDPIPYDPATGEALY